MAQLIKEAQINTLTHVNQTRFLTQNNTSCSNHVEVPVNILLKKRVCQILALTSYVVIDKPMRYLPYQATQAPV